MKSKTLLPVLLLTFLSHAQIPVSLPDNSEENSTIISLVNNNLELTWPVKNALQCQLVFNLEKDQPLFSTIAMGSNKDGLQEIATDVDPVFMLDVGKRTLKPENGWTIFFDKVPTRPYTSHLFDLEKRNLKITKHGKRTIVTINDIKTQDFEGALEITIYNGIPLFNIAAVISTQKDSTAILYDAGLTTSKPWRTISFSDTADVLRKAEEKITGSSNEAVKYRTILGSKNTGSLAVFPPPHQYFYPLDEAFNLKSVWHGSDYRNMVKSYGMGIRHDPKGDERYVPWFNAPPGTSQRLNFFCLLGSGSPGALLEDVKALTHDDVYVPLKGYKTMSSHFHNEFIMNVVLANKPVPEKPEFVHVFKNMGVDIVHLGEFHYTAHPKGPDDKRLNELRALFEQCERLSDDSFLLLPGEEPNEFLGGHWMNFFPNPVYWIMSRKADKPFVTEDPTYGKVYRINDKNEMLRLLELENGLAWTAHPRIKGSTGYPDKYKEEPFFKSKHFLGGAWKPMPADLSTPKLGLRVLDLMDDMNNWGAKKKIIAESDLFTITLENEMYAHMNVNYLQMDALPNFNEGWQPVLDAMSTGRFFSTTGEVLIPSFSVNGRPSGETTALGDDGNANIQVAIDWTFPLHFVEIISGDGENVFREKFDLNHTEAFGSEVFEFKASLPNREWVRIEVWDVAANGAFTQTVYLSDKNQKNK